MNILSRFKDITTFVFDIDGVLTDGTLLITEQGEMLRRMNIRDGYALQLAVKKGYQVWIISGGKQEAPILRLKRLGITEAHYDVGDKKQLLQSLWLQYGNTPAQTLYMGDDIPDHAAMKLCGLPTCPADAAPEIIAVSQYVSHHTGGTGCVRDVIEKVLKLNGHWDIPE
ncbi:3-deoxy-D-manno-octulosonate 8-phosphate phosphatase [Rurimicrobium arvi]|uniref:HAD-IIIA family hydrolase n=1 Tax=Rurimicrobium arvi TaxID=2049916 RepID=A0ABP8N2X4_9BACT